MDLIVRLGQSPSPPAPLQQHHGRPNCLTCPKEEGIKASRRGLSSRSAIKHCSSPKSEDLLVVPGKRDSDDAFRVNCQNAPHIPAGRLEKLSGTCASAETAAMPMHFSHSGCVWGCSAGDDASRSKASQPRPHLLKLGGSAFLSAAATGAFLGLAGISRADLNARGGNGHGQNGGSGTGGGGRGHGDGGGRHDWDSPGSNDTYAGLSLVDSNVSEQEPKEKGEISDQRAQTNDLLSSQSENEDIPATVSYEESARIFDGKLDDPNLCTALSRLKQKIMDTAMKMIYLNLVAQDNLALSESESSVLLSLEAVQMLQSSGGNPLNNDDVDDEAVKIKQAELQGFFHAGEDVSYQGQGIMHGALKKHQPSLEEHQRSGLGKLSQKDTVADVRKDGDQPPQSESESPSEGLCLEQKQVVMNWLSGIAHSFATKQGGSQIQLSQREHLTEERVKDLVNEAIATALKQLTEAGGSSALAKRSETETLKRLQRETFSDLLKLRERLERIEQLSRTGRSDAFGNLGVARTKLKGDVKAGTAFVILEDSSSRHSRSALEQAGMLTGLDVKFTFETPFREKDVLITQCVAGQGSSVGDGRALGGPISLRKVHYIAQLNDDISISFVPFGAEGKDVTEIINPLQDQGLTAFSSYGPSLFSYCKGSALGATVSGSRCAFSFAQYLSGWGNQIAGTGGPAETESDPLCLSSLAQILMQPSEGLILSFCGLNRYWPTPPLPSSAGLHWSEMGPLVIPKILSVHKGSSSTTSHVSPGSPFSHANSPSPDWMDSNSHFYMDALESKGTSLLSIGVSSELDIAENVSIGGWAQIERGDLLQDSGLGSLQWGLNLCKNSGTGIDWGASIGSAKPDFWSMAMNDQESYPSHENATGSMCGSQLHLEAFIKLYCGRGFTLQPGLLYLVNQHASTPAVVIRSSWAL